MPNNVLDELANTTDPGARVGAASARGVRDLALDVLRAVCARPAGPPAVRHPLGFVCVPLHRGPDAGLCLHMWPPGAAADRADTTTSQMHAHSWDLLSWVVCGRLGNRIIAVRDEPDHPTHRLFRVVSGQSGADELRATGRLVACVPGEEEWTSAGRPYEIPAGAFHTTSSPRHRSAASIVLARTRPGAADLSLGRIGLATHRVDRRGSPAGETIGIARAVLDQMLREPPAAEVTV
ncbi:MAG TPA: hypothetical protein VGL93_28200 [Streptosporangiaceae bacterium]